MAGTGQTYIVIDLGGTIYIRIIYIEPLFETNHNYRTIHTTVHSFKKLSKNKY